MMVRSALALADGGYGARLPLSPDTIDSIIHTGMGSRGVGFINCAQRVLFTSLISSSPPPTVSWPFQQGFV